MSFPKPVTLDNLLVGNHHHFRHKTALRKNGQPCEVRQSSKVRTWKRTPEKFEVSVKYGLYQSFVITNENCHEWELI